MTTPAALLEAYDTQLRRRIPPVIPPGHEYRRIGPLLRVTGLFRGFVESGPELGVEGVALDRLIAEQRDFFAARGESVEWKTRGHDRPGDLPERLRAAGFESEEAESVLVGESTALEASGPLPAGVTIREVRSRADLQRVAAMETTVWGEDFGWLAEDLGTRIAADPEQIVVLVAEAREAVVSAAWAVFRPDTDFTGLWGGSTLAEWRGRGIYRALVAERARIAAARGVPYLQVDASDDSAPILRRLGFVEITTTTPWVWQPGR